MQSQDVPRSCLVLDSEKIGHADILLPYASTRVSRVPQSLDGPTWPDWEIKHLVFSCKHQ